MADHKLSTVAMAAIVLLGTSAPAFAQQAKKATGTTTFTQRESASPQDPLAPAGARKTLQWDDKTGRWGLRLDVDQPASRESRPKEADLGAFYRVTPSLRVGGSVGLTTPAQPKPIEPDANSPRVRLETSLKF